jgi:hypothetical protein
MHGIAFLTAQKTQDGWMGNETLSRVYGLMHLDYALVMMRQSAGVVLRALAWEWLDLLKFALVRSWDLRVGRCLWYGERSAEGGREQVDDYDDLAAWFLGLGVFPAGHTLDLLILQALRPELEALKARPLANPGWVMAEPVTLWVGDDGVAMCAGRELNHNTPKVCASTTVGASVGEVLLAPAAPYLNRIREQDTQGVAVADAAAGTITYTADPRFFPGITLRLPRVNVLRYRLGGVSVQGEAVSAGGSAGPLPPIPVSPAHQAPPAPPPEHSAHKGGGLPRLLIGVAVVVLIITLIVLALR